MNFIKHSKKQLALSLAILSLSAPLIAAPKLNTDKEKLSYAIGADIGENFRKQNIDVDIKVFMHGLKDAFAKKKLLMKSSEMEESIRNFQKDMIKKKAGEFNRVSEKNKQKGKDFLSNNKKNSKVKTTTSGLQYEIIKKGAGKSPSLEDTVTVNYTGKLINGTVFDSTEKNGSPATFKLKEVIKGWTEALQMMKPGGHWRVFIPPELAYGERGVGGPIGPNETLIFDIELLSIAEKK